MADQRFPLRKYLRQLADMEYDIRQWRYRYQTAAANQPGLVSAARYEERAYLLETLEPRLHELFHELEQLPRLS